MSWELLTFGLALPWLLLGFGCWLGYQLLRQNGRLLLRLESLERLLAHTDTIPATERRAPRGLRLGSIAPEFTLPDLAGERRTLSDWRGRRVLLLFFNPRCGFCARMAPDLAALPTDGAEGRPMPLIVSTGDAGENRALVRTHNLPCPVLLQNKMEVATQYEVYGTPMGYLIDEVGKIASEVAVGAPALLELAGPAQAAAGDGNGHRTYRGNRSLAESRLNRGGLKAGTPAPNFRLPRLGGGELSLDEYRGRRVLIVFSAPDCVPCDELAPDLERRHRGATRVRVLMVSRGDRAANQAKAVEHGLTFPIALQRHWEVSRQYAMFATPIAYLIDEEGIIAADVAAGKEAILDLFEQASAMPGTIPAKLTAPLPGASEAARRHGWPDP